MVCIMAKAKQIKLIMFLRVHLRMVLRKALELNNLNDATTQGNFWMENIMVRVLSGSVHIVHKELLVKGSFFTELFNSLMEIKQN